MKIRYQNIMEKLYLACIVLSAAAVVVMTAIIPYGVVMRYLVHSPQSWPEPLAVLLMIVFTFIGLEDIRVKRRTIRNAVHHGQSNRRESLPQGMNQWTCQYVADNHQL